VHVPHRRSAEAARAAIQETALDLFVDYGYEGTSLEEIAEKLELTRQAVLYHFGSKAELFLSVVVPSVGAIVATLDSLPASDPPTHQERENALGALVDVMCEHRMAVAVMTRFANERRVAHLAPTLLEINQKGGRILGGTAIQTDPILRVKVVATMAALSGIMGARLNVPLATPGERRALVEGCLAILES
jgi:AcrR family transcriptional regulator